MQTSYMYFYNLMIIFGILLKIIKTYINISCKYLM